MFQLTSQTVFQDIPEDILKEIILRMTLPTIFHFVRTSKKHLRLFDIPTFNRQNGSNCLTWSEVASLGTEINNKPFWKPVFIHNSKLKNLNRRKTYKISGRRLELTGQPGLLYTMVRTYLIRPMTNVFRFQLISLRGVPQLELGCWKVRSELPPGRRFIVTSFQLYSCISRVKIKSGTFSRIPDELLNGRHICFHCHMSQTKEKFIRDPSCMCLTNFLICPKQIYQLKANYELGQIELSINDIFVCSETCDLTKKMYFFAIFNGTSVVQAL